MNKEKIKIILAWIFLIFLIALFIYINYLKFFGFEINNNIIEEIPIENSSSHAIELALNEIVDNFNNDILVEENINEDIELSAYLNNYSIYVSYNSNDIVTYEFEYSNLVLSINVTNEEENLLKFNKIYEILIKAIQKRIGNNDDITNLVNNHLNENISYDGLTKEINGDTIKYSINITKKLTEEGSE